MKWSTRDLGLAAYLNVLGVESISVDVQRDQLGRAVGFFVFESEPDSELLAQWVNRSARVEPQELLFAFRSLKHTLFNAMGER